MSTIEQLCFNFSNDTLRISLEYLIKTAENFSNQAALEHLLNAQKEINNALDKFPIGQGFILQKTEN